MPLCLTLVHPLASSILAMSHVRYHNRVQPSRWCDQAAYIYDAGPNATIYIPKENIKKIVELLLRYFPQSQPSPDPDVDNEGRLPDGFNEKVAKVDPRGKREVIYPHTCGRRDKPTEEGAAG